MMRKNEKIRVCQILNMLQTYKTILLFNSSGALFSDHEFKMQLVQSMEKCLFPYVSLNLNKRLKLHLIIVSATLRHPNDDLDGSHTLNRFKDLADSLISDFSLAIRMILGLQFS